MSRSSIATGAALLAGSTIAVRRDGPGSSEAEATVFRSVNELPDALRPVLWPTMQLGNGLMAVAVPVAVIAATKPDPDWDLAGRGAAVIGR